MSILALAVGCTATPPPADPRGDATLRALDAVLREHGWPCDGVARYEVASENEFRAWCRNGSRYDVLLTEEAASGDVSRQTSLYPLFEVAHEVELLRAADAAERRSAAERLRLLGKKATAAVPQLVTATADPEAGVRAAASAALGAIGSASDAVKRALSKAAQDPDPGVRASAQAALDRLARG